ncbi:cytochrome P450 [Exidia glandulosa HHB12029]|uniref:Cytochrome P450 n=1 Tax=Exidia glandulosa HHB12029 TaxID=1314781 RepID=A0A165EI35_EXIGL|nr:cytochrome P450 [Exidia glandulosa HHB12029]
MQSVLSYYSRSMNSPALDIPLPYGLFAFACALGLAATIRLLLSPLRGIPGPWYANMSDAHLSYYALRFDKSRALHKLFLSYGRVVRIAPRIVMFSSASALRAIGSHPKHSMYAVFNMRGVSHTFTFLDSKSHAGRRRVVLGHWLPMNLTSHEADITHSVSQLTSYLRGSDGQTPLDALVFLRHFMVDVIFSYVLEVRVGALEALFENVTHELSDAVTDFPKEHFLRSVVPTPLWNLLKLIPHERWRRFCRAEDIMLQVAEERMRELQTTSNVDTSSLMGRMMSYASEHKGDPLSVQDIATECAVQLIAGAETTSTTASFGLWELSKRPDIVRRIREELTDHNIELNSMSGKDLHRLPYLDAFLKEVLRLYAPVPTLLMRTVPKGQHHVMIGDVEIPAGVTVGVQAWTMHRDPDAFINPEEFVPERWLAESDAQNNNFMPFGIPGVRSCIGKHLGLLSLKTIIAAVVLNFDIAPGTDTTERTMRVKDAFVALPAGQKAEFYFRPLVTEF